MMLPAKTFQIRPPGHRGSWSLAERDGWRQRHRSMIAAGITPMWDGVSFSPTGKIALWRTWQQPKMLRLPFSGYGSRELARQFCDIAEISSRVICAGTIRMAASPRTSLCRPPGQDWEKARRRNIC